MSNTRLLATLYPQTAKNIQAVYEAGPEPTRPVVTLRDVDARYLDRYFVQMVTDRDYIVEVDKVQYELFKTNPRFTTVVVRWKIVGKKESIRTAGNTVLYGVDELNREEILRADLTIPGIRRYIRDYTEFWFSEDD